MAVDTTTITPTITATPFAGYTQSNVDTVGARGVIEASVSAVSIPAPGAGDNQLLKLNITLPPNFAYSMVDYCLELRSSSSVFNWQDNSVLQINQNTAGNGVSRPVGLKSTGTGLIGSTPQASAYYVPVCPTTALFRGINADSPFIQADFFNSTANDVEYFVLLYSRFLQFDIEQLRNLEVNSPIPVR